ncbi:class I SAM-dependent methyltransferase [Paracoccus sp. SCSIO 75233]|uniref:class I SAM-dependent methyltransferase n=1 Tax=Paracoccus sp. SCSIO 75233 TaxID=3017782 RepID=UPI0022EFF9C2|nr:class I SAM-dependent methyltransferase [Paracoccus sp. SCSIO 75233]WBU52361.1 class I SAM-dependent methyltransferase [Paracoccus sp. SCSIO 75233]
MVDPVASIMTHCRACGSDRLFLFLPMGDHLPANMLVRPEDAGQPQPGFPLNSQACLDCGMIQVADQIPEGFFRHYLYIPSGAVTMHGHFEELAQVLVEKAEGGLIADIGCNDGLMLGFANRMGAKTLGIDPAANLAERAAENGVEVHVAYFGPETADEVRAKYGRAKVISTTNTLNHIGDLAGFMDAIGRLLTDDGWFVVEVPWGRDIIRTNQFDNIYHEHLSEMSLRSLVRMAERAGMAVQHVTYLPVHGGSMRVFIRRADMVTDPSEEVTRMLAAEDEAGMTEQATFEGFADRARKVGEELHDLLGRLKAEGASIAGYGAPAKGNTLLNFFRIGPETVEYLVDRNPLKQGMLSPGMQIPIHDPSVIAERKPDYLLVLAWNFFDEIRTQLADYEAAGGRFILPLPFPKIVE